MTKQLTFLSAAAILVACSTMPAQAKALNLNNVCGQPVASLSLEAGHDAQYPNIVKADTYDGATQTWDLKLLEGDITIHCFVDGSPASEIKPAPVLPAGLTKCTENNNVMSCR